MTNQINLGKPNWREDVKSLMTEKVEDVSLVFPNRFLEADLKDLMEILDENLFLSNITLEGDLSAYQTKAIADISNRNKLLSYFKIGKENLDEPWMRLIDAHFKEYHPGGHYYIIKNSKDRAYVNATTALGATWHRQLFKYLDENKFQLQMSGCPYNLFSSEVYSDMPYELLDQILAFNEYIEKPDAYFPFSEISIQATTLGVSNTEVLDDINDEIVKLFEHASKHNVEKIGIKFFPDESSKENKVFEENIDRLLDGLYASAQKGNITTQIKLGKDYSTHEKLIALNNIIQSNVRQKNKSLRLGHFSQERQPHLTVKKSKSELKEIDIRACKRNAASALDNIGVEVQLQQQSQQQQQQQQQEQQQVQMQAQKDQMLEDLKKRRGEKGDMPIAESKDFINYKDFEAYKDNEKYLKNSYSTQEPYQSIEQVWDNIVGDKGIIRGMVQAGYTDVLPPIISGISKSVADLLVTYPQLFPQGLNLNDLPPGFVLKQDKDNEKNLLLDYDSTIEKVLSQNPEKHSYLHTKFLPIQSVGKPDWYGDSKQFSAWPENPLTEEDFDSLKGLGRKKIFLNGTSEEKQQLLLKLIKNEDFDIGESIENNYQSLISLFKEKDDFMSLSNIVYREGAQGIKILLDKLDDMRRKFGDESTAYFISSFIGKNPKEVAKLMSNSNLEGIDRLQELSQGEYAWWESLNKQEEKYNKDINFLNQLDAFLEFKQKLKNINPDIEMTAPCPFTDVKNMKVALSRVLGIVNNALDPQEQFYHLDGLSLDQYDAYYASQEVGYYFVSKEMVLNIERVDLSMRQGNVLKKIYEISLEYFEKANGPSIQLEKLKAHYFRLLGQQSHIDPYDNYVDLIKRFDSFSEDYESSRNDDKPDSIPKVALGLLALSSTHKYAMGTIRPEIIDHLFNALENIAKLPTDERQAIESSLLSYCALENNHIAKPTCDQLPSLIQFHEELGAKHKWNLGADPRETKVIAENYFNVIETKHKTSLKFKDTEYEPLTAKNLISVIEAIKRSEMLNTDENRELKDKLFGLFAFMCKKDFDENGLNNLLANIESKMKNDADSKKILTILNVLTDIDPLHEKTTGLPDISQVDSVITSIFANEEIDSYSDISNNIIKKNGFSKCYFNNVNMPSFNPNYIKELMEQNKDKMESMLKVIGINLTENDLDNPIKFLEEIKKAPMIWLLTSEFWSSIKDNVTKEHYLNLNDYAKTKLSLKDNEKMLKDLCFIFEGKLYKKDIEKSSDIDELLITLQNIQNREGNTCGLVDILAKIKTKSLPDYTKLVDILKSGHGVSEIPIAHLTQIIDVLNRSHRKEFPHEVLDSIVNNNAVKRGLIQDWGDVIDRKIDGILKNTQLSFSQISKSVNLILDLIGQKYPKKEIDAFYKILNEDIQTQTGLIGFFDAVLNTRHFDEVPLIKDRKLISSVHNVLGAFENKPNKDLLKNNLSRKLTSSPLTMMSALPILSDISGDNKNDVVSNLVIILGRLQSNDYNESTVPHLLSILKDQEITLLSALANFDEDLDFPSSHLIIETIKNGGSIDLLISECVREVTEERNQVLKEQFSDLEVHRVLEGMIDLSRNDRVYFKEREALQKDFYFINAVGHSHAIRTDLVDINAPSKIIKDMSKQEIVHLLNQHKNRVRNLAEPEKNRKESQLIYLALLRESMYRTTGRVPYSTQILSVLSAINKNGNNISEIQTGQGKSLMSALYAAMLELEGQAVDVCTSNQQLARESLDENKKFYDYVGIPVGIIDSNSPAEDYNHAGVNYSDVSQLALFRARMHIEGNEQPEKSSLVLDEADYTLLDDTTQYRYAVNLDDVGDPSFNPYGWVYELVNEFIETSTFNDLDASKEDDIHNLRAYLIEHAPGALKSLAKDTEQITNKQLDIWIDSSVAARELHKLKDKKWTLKEEEAFGKKVSVARLIVNDRVSPDAQWSNGIQQMIHARINHSDPDIRDEKKPKCHIDPEKQAVASTTSKNFVDYYNQRGGYVYGVTGTIGSEKEREEYRNKFNFSLVSIPEHQGQRRIDRQPIMVNTDAEHQEKIFSEVLKRIRSNNKMPVLIICKDAPTSKALSDFIESKLSKNKKNYPLSLQLFNGIDNKKIDYGAQGKVVSALDDEFKVREQAGRQGTITISTPMMGRGTDVKPEMRDKKNKVEENWIKHSNGLFVIQSYVDSERTSRQILGRSGRQGWFGETMMIASKEALQRDFELVGHKDKVIQNVSSGIEELRTINNLSAKQRRLFSEAHGDFRNFFFARLIPLLASIPAYHEAQDLAYQEALQKDQDLDQFDLRSIPEIKKSILKQWENFLNDYDLNWKNIVSEQNEPDLKCSLDRLSEDMLPKWNKLIKPYQSYNEDSILLEMSKDNSDNIINHIVESSRSNRNNHLPDYYKALPKDVNIDKIVCDISVEKNLNLVHSAYHKELDYCLERLMIALQKNKNIKINPPENWYSLDPDKKFKFLNQTIQHILSNKKALKGFQSFLEIKTLERDIGAGSIWLSAFSVSHENEVKNDSVKKLSEKIKMVQFQIDLEERMRLSKHEPKKLIYHDRDMLAKKQGGAYPEDISNQYFNGNRLFGYLTEMSIGTLKSDMLSDINDYRKNRFISRKKKRVSSVLFESINRSKNYNELLEAVMLARKNGVNFGVRFSSKMDKMLERLIANVTKDNIDALIEHEIQDIFTILTVIGAHSKNPHLKKMIENINKDEKDLSILLSLLGKAQLLLGNNMDLEETVFRVEYDIHSKIPLYEKFQHFSKNEPKLQAIVNAKIGQVIRLQQKKQMIDCESNQMPLSALEPENNVISINDLNELEKQDDPVLQEFIRLPENVENYKTQIKEDDRKRNSAIEMNFEDSWEKIRRLENHLSKISDNRQEQIETKSQKGFWASIGRMFTAISRIWKGTEKESGIKDHPKDEQMVADNDIYHSDDQSIKTVNPLIDKLVSLRPMNSDASYIRQQLEASYANLNSSRVIEIFRGATFGAVDDTNELRRNIEKILDRTLDLERFIKQITEEQSVMGREHSNYEYFLDELTNIDTLQFGKEKIGRLNTLEEQIKEKDPLLAQRLASVIAVEILKDKSRAKNQKGENFFRSWSPSSHAASNVRKRDVQEPSVKETSKKKSPYS